MSLVELMKTIFFIFLFISYTEQLSAQEYWVPSSQPTEVCTNISWLCIKNNAYPLSNTLLKRLKAGDSVYFNKGVYPAFSINNIHGTVDQPITFNGSFSIGKAEVSVNPTKKKDIIEIKQSSHIIVTGFNMNSTPRVGIRVNNSHHTQIDNGVWGIFTNHSNNFIETSNTIIGPAEQYGIYHSNCGDHVKITSNYIQNFDGSGIHINGDKSMGGKGRERRWHNIECRNI